MSASFNIRRGLERQSVRDVWLREKVKMEHDLFFNVAVHISIYGSSVIIIV